MPSERIVDRQGRPIVATFSIVAADPAVSEVGIAVASKFLAVGSVVPWVQAGVGAVATQAMADVSYGPRGLGLMAQGLDPKQVIEDMTAPDPGGSERQVGLVTADGRSATFTGTNCLTWAGGRAGDGYACQGNILAGPEVVDAMAEAYEAAQGELADRLMAALRAGDAAGGDRRGRQSAALYVARPDSGFLGIGDRMIDLRVDDHPAPIPELERILAVHRSIYKDGKRPLGLEITAALRAELRERLERALSAPVAADDDAALAAALETWARREGLAPRTRTDGRLDAMVVESLRARG